LSPGLHPEVSEQPLRWLEAEERHGLICTNKNTVAEMRRTGFKGERSIIPDKDKDSRGGKQWAELRSPFRRGLGRI